MTCIRPSAESRWCLSGAWPSVVVCLILNLTVFAGIASERPEYLSDYRLNANSDARDYVKLGRNFLIEGQYSRNTAAPYTCDVLRTPIYPLFAGSLDLITVAFGFRNLTNYGHGLEELARVLKPGGVLAILEFSQPTNRLFAGLYGFFSARVLPWVGGMISGSRDAYSYLPESIKKFPGAEGLAEQMQAAGFASVEFERLTFGAVALHIAKK